MKRYFLLFVLISSINLFTFAISEGINNAFIKNLGQISSFEGQQVKDVLYYVSTKNATLFITEKGLSYVFIKNNYKTDNNIDAQLPINFEWQRIDVIFENATLKKAIEENKVSWHYNYYLPHCPTGIKNVPAFKSLYFNNIYEGIDFKIYFNKNGQLKYDFIVNQNGDPSQIQLRYAYSNPGIINNDGSVSFINNLGEITEKAPIAYQNNNIIPIQWKLNQNVLSFDIKHYDKKIPLIIDPFLLWSTYFGGNGDEVAEYIYTNNLYYLVAGNTSSTIFPVTNPGNGAYYSGTNSGNSDMFIAKFNNQDIPEWITYYGGSNNDTKGKAIIYNQQYIYLVGQTWSDNIPTFNPGGGAYYKGTRGDPSQPNYSDGFIIKFDFNGALLWATYIGSIWDEDITSLTITNSGFYVLMNSFSNDLPITDPGNGAYIQPAGPASERMYLAKFDIANNQLIWSTYLSTSTTGINGMNHIVSYNNDVYLALNVKDTDAPIVDPNNGVAYVDNSYNGGTTDILIMKFNENNQLVWSTYFGGNGVEDARGLCVANNKLWIAGHTTSTNFPVKNPGNGAYFQNTNGGGTDGFIAAFYLSGEQFLTTYYGGSSAEYIRAITGDDYGIYITGLSSANLPLYNPGTPTFYQSSTRSIFVGKFKYNGKRQWVSYFCGNSPSQGRFIAVTNNAIYVVGQVTNSLLVQDPNNGCYMQSTFGGGSNDAFIAKFDKCVIPNLNLNIANNSICRYDTTYITASGEDATAYLWNTSESNDTIYVSPPQTEYYYVTITDDMTCTNNDSILVTVFQLPNVQITGNHPICFNDSITLYANGAQTYTWLPNNETTSSITYTLTDTTTFILVGIDTNNCVNKDTATVIVYPLPTVSITGNHPICFGDSITLYGNGAQSYFWLPPSIAADSITVSPASTTTFYVLGTDSNSCKNIDSAQVIVYPLPDVQIIGNHPICFGDYLTLYANGAQSYIWTPGNYNTDSIVVSPYTSTLFTLLGTDSNGCKNIDTTLVIVYSLPDVEIVGNHPICYGDSITLTASGAINYLWLPDSLNIISPTFTLYDTTTFILIGTDIHQCKNSDTATVIVNPLPNVQILGAHPICFGDYIDLTAINADSYIWNTNDISSTIHVNPQQTTTYTVTGTDQNGCKNSDTAIVVVNPLPIVRIMGEHPICLYDSITLEAYGADSYTWEPWLYNTQTITISPNTTTTVILTGTDLNGCTNKDTAEIMVYPLPQISIIGVHDICRGDSITLQATGAVNYDWQPIGMTGSIITIAPDSTNNYFVYATDEHLCRDTATFSIIVYDVPIASISGINRICQQETITLTASGGTSYLWNTNDTSETITASPMYNTTYSVIAYKDICSDTAYFTVQVDPKPTLTITHDTTIIIGMSLPLQVNGANQYEWTPISYLSCYNCNNPVAKPSETIEYCVEGTNLFGCSDTVCVTITVDKECGETFVPSAFSPNNDGMNDILYVRGKCIKTMMFTIYNRWGEKVFESTDPHKGWDGTFRGKEVDTGVYVYTLKAEYYNGTIINQKGNITLLR